MDFQNVSEVKFERLPKEKAVPVKSLKLLPKVDRSKFYRVTVQLGELKSWGNLHGARKTIIHPKKNPNDSNERLEVEHPISVFSVLPVPGAEVDGLIEGTRIFIDDNHNRTPDGDIRYMLAITEAEAIDHVPGNFNLMAGAMPMEFMKAYIQQMVTEGIAAVQATQKAGPGRPPKQDVTANSPI